MFDYQIWQQMDVIFIDLAAKDIKGPRISMAFFTMDHPSGPPVAMVDMSLHPAFEVPAAGWKHKINIRHKNRVPKADE